MNLQTTEGYVRVAGTDIPFDEAAGTILDYCLRITEREWTAPRNGVGDPVGQLSLRAFAYETYDCIAAGSTSVMEPIDVLVADGLNAQMRAADIGGVLQVGDLLSKQLETIDRKHICFWELSRSEVEERPAGPNNPAWPLWRGWALLMGVPGIDVARAHKILHHKRPHTFPLIDNQTLPFLTEKHHAWAAIHDDLLATAACWEQLERQVGSELTSHGRVRLTPSTTSRHPPMEACNRAPMVTNGVNLRLNPSFDGDRPASEGGHPQPTTAVKIMGRRSVGRLSALSRPDPSLCAA